MNAPSIAALLVLGAPAGQGSSDPAPAAADEVLFRGGRIRLGDGGGTVVRALLAREGRVVAVGGETAVRAVARGAPREVDLEGGTAVPGLADAHGHLASLGASLEEVDLVGAASADELVGRVAARAAETPKGEWVTGRGWDHTLWPDAAFPSHHALSAAVPEHPVLVRRVDGHAALANARALALAGLDGDLRAHPDLGPDGGLRGGRVQLDEEGRATGLLVDTAIGLVARRVPDPDEDAIARRILRAQEELLALGLTCVHEMGVSPRELAVLDALERSGELRLRVAAYLWGNEGLPEGAAARLDPERRVRVAGAKLMIDGALGSRGAALLDDYSDAPGERGFLSMEPNELARLVDRCAELGLQPATHAIGDRGNRVVLDAYEARLARDPAFRELRPRVEHAQVVAEGDLERFGELGVVPSVQPTHATTDMRWAEQRLGEERLAGAYAWTALHSPRSPLALGSDFPVESPSPLLGLYAARTRADAGGSPPGGWRPEHRLSGEEALAGFTRGAAYAAREDEARGSLLPGRFADLTVLDVDPVACEPDELLSARVLLVAIEGEVVHEGRAAAGAR